MGRIARQCVKTKRWSTGQTEGDLQRGMKMLQYPVLQFIVVTVKDKRSLYLMVFLFPLIVGNTGRAINSSI